jgi:radical SAM protein with 4Fe4S-binding SPASM domain
MRYFLSPHCALKWLETPSLYHIAKDELYELDWESFQFMKKCAGRDGCSPEDGAFIDYCLTEGLLVAEKPVLHRPFVARAPQPSLRYLELQITDKCNLQCKHCYIDNPSGIELSLDHVEKALDEFTAMQGLRVMITGGEPLLHSRFRELNALLPAYPVRKVLFSNGTLLTSDVLNSLRVDEIQISIDGLEHAHDMLRGPGNFQKSMTAAREALDAGFDVSVATMAHRGNLADFDAMEQLLKSMKIKSWSVDVPCSSGRLSSNESLRISPAEGGACLGYGYGDGLHASGAGFGCGLHLLSVMADGRIAKCSFYRDRPVGTVENGLAAAWSALRPIRLSSLTCDCDYLEICRGGCRFRAEKLEGAEGRDLYRCALYDIL